MKLRLSLIILLVFLSLNILCAQNLLANYNFINKTIDAYEEIHYSFCNYWHGYTDYTAYASDPSKHFVREIVGADSNVYFQRNYQGRTNEDFVYITNMASLGSGISFIPVDIYEEQIYEIGFSLQTNNIYFDPTLCDYGFSVKVEWYDSTSKLISTSREKANLDTALIAKTGVASATTGNNWKQYRNRVLSPKGAKYFKYYIVAGKGVYLDTADKVYIDYPVFQVVDKEPLKVNIVNKNSNYVYNNVFLKNGGSNNFSVNLKLNTADLPAVVGGTLPPLAYYIDIYNPANPAITYYSANSFDANPVFDCNASSFEAGKYIVRCKVVNKNNPNMIFKTVYNTFYVEDVKNYSGLVKKESNLLDIDGTKTFLIGLVDRGVNYGSMYFDVNGNPKGMSNPAGTTYGADTVGSNYGLVEESVDTNKDLFPANANDRDYLNYSSIISDNNFNYKDFTLLGLNAIYPAYLMRIPLIYKDYDFISGLNAVTNQYNYLNVFFPLGEFNRQSYSRDLQFKMKMESGLYDSNIFGSDNAFTNVAKTVAGFNNVVSYVIGDNTNLADLDEVKNKKDQMYKFDSTKPCAVTVDYNTLKSVSGDLPINLKYGINQFTNALVLNIAPKEKYWTDDELNQIKQDWLNGAFLNTYLKYDKSYLVFINFSLCKKQIKEGDLIRYTSLTPHDLIDMFQKLRPYVSGIFFDNVGSMTACNPDDPYSFPDYHYNLFRLFLKEKDSNHFIINDNQEIEEAYSNNPASMVSLKVGSTLSNLKDYFKELYSSFHKGSGDEDKNLINYYFYYNNILKGSSNKQTIKFSVSQEMLDMFGTMVITHYKSNFTSEETLNIIEADKDYTVEVEPNTISSFKMVLTGK